MINLIKKLPTLTQRIFIATTFAAAGLSFLIYSLNQLFIVFSQYPNQKLHFAFSKKAHQYQKCFALFFLNMLMS